MRLKTNADDFHNNNRQKPTTNSWRSVCGKGNMNLCCAICYAIKIKYWLKEFYSAAYSAKRRNFKMHTFRCNLKSIVLEKSEATAAFLSTALFSHDFANILE